MLVTIAACAHDPAPKSPAPAQSFFAAPEPPTPSHHPEHTTAPSAAAVNSSIDRLSDTIRNLRRAVDKPVEPPADQ
jgi:hypothetical protein